MLNFWTKLNKPIFCLAPMEEVTDVAFREMFARYSSDRRHSEGVQPTHSAMLRVASSEPEMATEESQKRDPSSRQVLSLEAGLRMMPRNDFVMYTEFVNVDGLTHPEGYKRLSLDLKFTEIQRPMVAQIWGSNPEKFYEAAKIVVGLGFDGIDINMGCPQDKEIGIGACAALIRDPELAGKIIDATIKGAGGLPVSVKTRLGYSKTNEMENWVRHLLQFNIAALALHARTKQEKSKVPAHWEAIAEAVKIRDQEKSQTLIIGNGDIKSRDEGLERIKQTGCDGVMVGRGAFGNPWFFRDDESQPNLKERLSVMLEHAALFEKEFGGIKSFFIMRKHFKAYANGFPGAAELRAELMETKSLGETKIVVDEFLATSAIL